MTRFWSKVRKAEGCWEWLGAKHGKGYGHVKYKGNVRKAHRVAYRLTFGGIPEGMLVMHTCDNPGCVNPSHLRIGTNQENMDDRNNKGRQARGERAGRVRLTRAKVIYARQVYADSDTPTRDLARLAREWGISKSAVFQAAIGRSWRHVG